MIKTESQSAAVPKSGYCNDLIPLHEPFDIARLGFNRRQVLDHLESLHGRIALLAADRDAALAQVAELSRVLDHLRREADEATAQVERILQEPMAKAGARIQRILQLVADEAAEAKAHAEAAISASKARADQDIAKLGWTRVRVTTRVTRVSQCSVPAQRYWPGAACSWHLASGDEAILQSPPGALAGRCPEVTDSHPSRRTSCDPRPAHWQDAADRGPRRRDRYLTVAILGWSIGQALLWGRRGRSQCPTGCDPRPAHWPGAAPASCVRPSARAKHFGGATRRALRCPSWAEAGAPATEVARELIVEDTGADLK